MSATNLMENRLMKHLFTNDNLQNIGDTTGLVGSTTAGSLHLALFSSDPGETGSGTELSYTGYGRVAIGRSATTFTVTDDTVTNATILNFGQNTGVSTETASYWAIFTDSTSGSGDCLFYGEITIPLVVEPGVIPSVPIGSLRITAN